VRDYIHVQDLAEGCGCVALLATQKLHRQPGTATARAGKVMRFEKKASGRPVNYQFLAARQARRCGAVLCGPALHHH
jgi:UDP-glucose 4-epimerase